METEQIEGDKDLSMMLQKIHECQVIYPMLWGSTMARKVWNNLTAIARPSLV